MYKIKKVLFFRDFKGFSGGHLKVWHYFNHFNHEKYTPCISFSQDSLWDTSNPWLPIKSKVLSPLDKRDPDIIFLAGLDWLRKDEIKNYSDTTPIINLIQHVRHSHPDTALYSFLQNKAIRICVSEQVTKAITQTGQVNGPIYTIPNGIDLQQLPLPIPFKDRTIDILIAGLKQNQFAQRLYDSLEPLKKFLLISNKIQPINKTFTMYSAVNLPSNDSPVIRYLSENHLYSPVIVGGVGGSGTSLITQLLKSLGFFMGDNLNESEDALAFVPFYERYINSYLMDLPIDYQHLADELLAIMTQHRGDSINGHLWGWKNPRSIYLLPIFDFLIPSLRFVHVVRNGIAMSTSDNQTQLIKHGNYVLQGDMHALPQNQRSLLLWAIVNNAAADYGQTMGDRYFLMRYEDACENPINVFSAIQDSFGLKLHNVLNVPIIPPKIRQGSISQYFNPLLGNYVEIALKRFGYSC